MAQQGITAAVIVEDQAKADRYTEKLIHRHRVRLVDQSSGPVDGTIVLRFAPRGDA